MTRRRAKWLLAASITAAGVTYYESHITWLATLACILVWALYAAAHIGRRHHPRRHHPRRHADRPRPRVIVANTPTPQPTDFDPHGTYHAYNRGRVWYVGENRIGDGRDFLTRATEHVRDEKWWPTEITAVAPVGWYPTELAAQANEAWDIHTLDPPRNRTHRNWMHSLEDCQTIARARAAGYTIPPPSTARPAARADPLEAQP